MHKPIVTYPNDVLRKMALPVSMVELKSGSIYELATRMMETMVAENGIGLAANQIGILKRVILIGVPGPDGFFGAMVNPFILKSSGIKSTLEEGCLSFPGQLVNVERPEEIEVQYWDVTGKMHTNTFSGLVSKCIQHEIDHLNGVLMNDYGTLHEKSKT